MKIIKEKIKKNWLPILIVLIPLILSSLYFLFVFDIGLNSEYFIRRDFNRAFLFRQTGNCDVFKDYIISEYADDWAERCIEEKDKKSALRIKEFSIKNITMAQDIAHLQVELKRDLYSAILSGEIKEPSEGYVVNYETRKETDNKKLFGFLPQTRFLISQPLK